MPGFFFIDTLKIIWHSPEFIEKLEIQQKKSLSAPELFENLPTWFSISSGYFCI